LNLEPLNPDTCVVIKNLLTHGYDGRMIGRIFKGELLCKTEAAATGGLFICAGLRDAPNANPITHQGGQFD
jgi:hypothetical protein